VAVHFFEGWLALLAGVSQGFDAVFFYTTGDLTSEGTDKQPPMSTAGKQALLDYVNKGGGFVGTHSAADTFHTTTRIRRGRTVISITAQWLMNT